MNCNLSQVDKKSLVKEEQTMQCHSPILNMLVNVMKRGIFTYHIPNFSFDLIRDFQWFPAIYPTKPHILTFWMDLQ